MKSTSRATSPTIIIKIMNPYVDNYCVLEEYKNALILKDTYVKPYKLTPLIVTLCKGNITSIDLSNFIEMGMKIVRFKISHISRAEKIGMLQMLEDAVKWVCEKYEVSTWPVAVCIDIPNATIKTGYIKSEIYDEVIQFYRDRIVVVTADLKYWRQCDSELICINDIHTIKNVTCGTEISIRSGHVILVVIEIVNSLTLKCKVLNGGPMRSLDFVCVRGVKHTKPILSEIDLQVIKFAKHFKVDIVTINYLRRAETLQTIRKMFSPTPPLIISTICEQEGLDNIDDIIKISDGIILAREFLAYEIADQHKMITIQMHISAKCKQAGVPFYLSGNILERTLETNFLKGSDMDDITNAVLQGAGLVLSTNKEPAPVLQALKHLNEICKAVEPVSSEITDFWRVVDEAPAPVNAAEGCIVACAMMAKMSHSVAIIVPTVTGLTALWLSQMAPDCIILAISRNPSVARKLQIRRGIIPIVYDRPIKDDWYEEIDERIKFAINYGVKYEILTYGSTYVEFKKSLPSSAYSDNISTWTVVTEGSKKIRKNCPY